MRILLAIIPFIWSGYVLAISFMEAPLKFRAPNITVKLAVGIGKLVFGTLNKIELVFITISLVCMFLLKIQRSNLAIYMGVIFIILMIQTFYILPILTARANLIIAGGTPDKSIIHFFYVIGDIIKLICLLLFGYKYLTKYFV